MFWNVESIQSTYSHVPAYIRFGIYSFFRNFENFDFDSAYIRENMVDFDVELDACSIQETFLSKDLYVKIWKYIIWDRFFLWNEA